MEKQSSYVYDSNPFRIPMKESLNTSTEDAQSAYETSKPLGVDNHTKEEREGLEADRVPGCFGEYNPSIYWCNGCKYGKECLITTNKIKPSETKDDLIGIAEAEPPWDQITRSWVNIENELALIKMLYKERAVEDFREKLQKMMEGL